MITMEEAVQLFEYNPETGILKWKIDKGNIRAGKVINGLTNGYLTVRVNYRIYPAHRIIWLLYYGVFPEGRLDHKNRVRTDNRITNLRSISTSENNKNRTLQSNNKSGHHGVFKRKDSDKWMTYINKNGVRIYLGSFISKEDAVSAYEQASLKLYPEINGGL